MTLRASKPAFNVREKLTELERPIGIKGNEVLRTETVKDAFDVLGCGRKNFIINGAMEIWQRGTSFSDISNGDYTADRFFNQKTATTNVERVSITDTEMLKYGFRYAMRQTAVAASQIKPLQIIEKHPLFVAGNKFTFSFWARSNSPISYTFQHYDGSSVFNSKTVYIETEWKRYVIPLTLTTTPSSYLRIHLTNSRNAGDWLETTGWQYEQGSVATPFEHRFHGEELALCQRYYQVWKASDPDFNGHEASTNSHGSGGNAYSTLLGNGSVHDADDCNISTSLPVEMRDAPTTTLTDARVISGSAIYDNATIIQINNSSRKRFSAFIDNEGGMTSKDPVSLVLKGSNALLALDAEL